MPLRLPSLIALGECGRVQHPGFPGRLPVGVAIAVAFVVGPEPLELTFELKR